MATMWVSGPLKQKDSGNRDQQKTERDTEGTGQDKGVS